MFELLKRLVGQDQRQEGVGLPIKMAALRAPLAPQYDANLLSLLSADHRGLLDQFLAIGTVVEHGQLGELPPLLASFKVALQKHLIEKNVRFYNYIENSLATDSENLRLIRRFRREMNSSARGLADFIKKYDRLDLAESVRPPMLREYAEVASELAQRIEREENKIFPLYQPEQKAASPSVT